MGGGKIEIKRIENSSNRLIDSLDRYEKQSGKRLWDAKHENFSNEIDRIKKENDRMEIELRQLMGEDITSLHYKELIEIEKALENGLVGVRDKQMEIVIKMKDKNFLARMQMPKQEEENDQEAEQEEEEEQAHYEPMAGCGDPLAVDVSSVMLQQLVSCFDNHLEIASTAEEKVDRLQASHD